MHWNLNSIPAHDFSRIPLIQAYNSIHNFHLIAITETALKDSIPDDKIDIPGYSPIRCDLPNNDSHGGVLIYHKLDLSVKKRPDLSDLDNTIVLELSISRKKLIFVLSYRKRSQSPSDFIDYSTKFDELLSKINAEVPYCTVVTGDFNSHNNAWFNGDKSDNFGTTMQDIFNTRGLSQLVDKPTYITDNANTCIDLVATDQPNLIMNNEIHPSLHTYCHHQMNYVRLNLKCPPTPYKRFVWHYDRSDVGLLRAAVKGYNWQYLNSLDNPDDQINHFDEVILNVAKNFIPNEEKTFHPRDPPWLTNNCRVFYKNFKLKYKRFVQRNCPPADKPRIDALRVEYTNLVQKEKEKYLKHLGSAVADPRTGQKKYWTAFKKLLNNSTSSLIPPILHAGTFVTDIKEKCDLFNDYFKNQCKTIATSSMLPPFEKSTDLSINEVHFSPSNIIDHIRKLNINKAHGHDGITSRILKMCDDSISIPLFIIYKNCISKGYFPKKWKKANVSPVHKKNDRNLVQNHRPISLLPICGKIFEKIIYDNLYCYIFDNNFITDKQSGYRRGDSTVKQLLSITHEIYKAFDESKELRAVFLDISRAFDRVWHDGLLYKLKRIGIEGEIINILSSFLSSREQRVVIDGKCSDWAKIEAGVPQGSILGPLLFLIYINDITEVVTSDLRIFADDTFIFRIADQNSTEDLNLDLENITGWAHQWKMLFNPDISKQAVEIIFSNKKIKSVFEPLVFNGIPVKLAEETKHLGVTLDNKLSFISHLNAKLAKARQGLGLMWQLKKFVPSYVLEVVYKLYIRPHFDYGDVVYHTANIDKISPFNFQSHIAIAKNIESVQYGAARIITGAWKGTSIKKLYENLGWESLNDRRIMRKLCILYETLNDKFPRYLLDILNQSKFAENSRSYNKQLLKNIPCNKKIVKTSFFPSTIADWNKLDIITKESRSKASFKKRMLNKIRPKKSSYFGMTDNDRIKYITMLRMNLSPLRAHKHKYNFADISDPLCIVCKTPENTEHYLLHCKSYALSRVTLLRKVSLVVKTDILTMPKRRVVSILLCGMESLTIDENLCILNNVADYIASSKRLDIF